MAPAGKAQRLCGSNSALTMRSARGACGTVDLRGRAGGAGFYARHRSGALAGNGIAIEHVARLDRHLAETGQRPGQPIYRW
jgi:hypothetical protein